MTVDSRRLLEQAAQHAAVGQLTAAEEICRQWLADHPDDVNILAYLGALLIKLGKPVEAAKKLQQAIAIEPDFEQPKQDLELLRKAVPFAAQLADAAAARAAGDLLSAQKHCDEILRQAPGDAGALKLAALTAVDARQFTAADAFFMKLLALPQADDDAYLQFARNLGEQGRYVEAIELLENRRPDSSDIAIDLTLADMLAIVNRVHESLAAYDRVLARSPDNGNALLGRGHMLRVLGDLNAAQVAYRQCTNHPQLAAEAWWSLLSLSKYIPTDDDKRDLENRLQQCGDEDPAKVQLHFAMARYCEREQSFEEAWRDYCDGNKLKRAAISYDPVEIEVQLKKIKTVFSKRFFESGVASSPNTSVSGESVPIFVVGMPRSGSTLIEQILASHSTVHGCGELPYVIMLSNALRSTSPEQHRYPEAIESLQPAQFVGLGKSYRYHVREHLPVGCTHFTDKMPANFMHVGFILSMLPEAKIIDARRHPLATTVANFRQLFAQGKNQGYDLTEFAEYYLQYIEAMEHWNEVVPGRVLRVDYETVVTDLNAAVQEILDFCGLAFEQACIEFHQSDRAVNTASADQVRQPVYATSVESWKRYEPWLDEVKTIFKT